MDKKRLNLRIVAAIAACLAVTMFASCKKETPDLKGTVTISPTANVFTGTELTAAYSGSEKIKWQWNKGGTAIGGATNDKFTPTEAGNYTVTANAAGYNSKTSAAVEVKAIQNLNGTVTISSLANAFIGDELTATYSGSETVSWQWNKSGTAINGATAAKYTPTEAGSYTVTASAKGFNSKTSAAVEVKAISAILLEEKQYGNKRVMYEYDNQNRIAKQNSYFNGQPNSVITFTYNAIGDLVEINEEFPLEPTMNSKTTFTKNGSKITWERYGNNEMELNSQGLPAKFTNVDGTRTYTWQNGNVIKADGINWEDDYTWTETYTYDDNKSPFYYSKTPKWLLLWWEGSEYCNENNRKTGTWDGGGVTYTYTYNADGFPETRTWSSFTETYKYKKK